jgi:hypothetical protein
VETALAALATRGKVPAETASAIGDGLTTAQQETRQGGLQHAQATLREASDAASTLDQDDPEAANLQDLIARLHRHIGLTQAGAVSEPEPAQ